jgi:hypothetical protein
MVWEAGIMNLHQGFAQQQALWHSPLADVSGFETRRSPIHCPHSMARTGFAHLPLHGGKAPRYLFERMVPLSREIITFVAREFGREDVLRRLSDPYWFQAFGCVLGFDWHSSGLTTTVCGALKEGLRDAGGELGIFVSGGKGATSRKTPAEITAACEQLGRDPEPLVYASRISAKVDNAAVQDGYQLYHHSFVFTENGQWCIVQQGMSDETSMARRYHWFSDNVRDYVNEPHAAICCDTVAPTLNLVAAQSADVRAASALLAGQKPELTLDALGHLPTLDMPRRHEVVSSDINPNTLRRCCYELTRERRPTSSLCYRSRGSAPRRSARSRSPRS